jgi:hypothetical protein
VIIVRINGGLGNQLFQYAAAKALAVQHGTELKLDVTQFAGDTLRNFDLANMNVPVVQASVEEINQLKAHNTVQRVKQRLLPTSRKTFYKEPFFHYDRSYFRLGKNVYLQGYFQSEKYFTPIQSTIRRNFNTSHLVNDSLKKLAAELQQEHSVSIHIRRGDYQNAELMNFHGILPAAYYQKAAAQMKEKFPAVRFFLFSDNPAAVSEEFAWLKAEVVSGTVTKNHFEDLYLMQHCRHNIIANSSFSWWAAWLNNNPEKIVIAPKNWFANGPKDTQDLLPEGWQTV